MERIEALIPVILPPKSIEEIINAQAIHPDSAGGARAIYPDSAGGARQVIDGEQQSLGAETEQLIAQQVEETSLEKYMNQLRIEIERRLHVHVGLLRRVRSQREVFHDLENILETTRNRTELAGKFTEMVRDFLLNTTNDVVVVASLAIDALKVDS